MWIQPHENLAILTIRHDQFGPGRYDPIDAGRGRGAGVHNLADGRLHGGAEPGPVRLRDRVDVITQARTAQPIDCHTCDRASVRDSGDYEPYMPEVWETQAPRSDPPVMLLVIYDKTAISQGFTHGQSVPAAGSLLDIFA